MEAENKKYYCIYLPYSKWDIMGEDAEESMPEYPVEFGRVRVYDNSWEQLNAYGDHPCPASQTFEAETEQEISDKIEEFRANFLNEKWLDENIRPFI